MSIYTDRLSCRADVLSTAVQFPSSLLRYGHCQMPKRDVDRILIIDDDLATLLALPALIRPYFPDAIIQTAPNGDVALNWLRDYRYRLILLDIRIPGIDGLALLREFRTSFGPAQVIVTTGAIDDKLKAEVLTAGVYAFLEKPVLPQTLIETIKAALRESLR